MKKCNSTIGYCLLLLLALFTPQLCMTTNATDIFLKKDNSIPPDPQNSNVSSETLIPINAAFDDAVLAINFNSPIGIVTITVYDQANLPVYQETIDTSTSPELDIQIGGWDSGNYKLCITYNNIALSGDFEL
ncbi:MAG TPA: DUF3244 domain-containing protein [Paludibacter sp.]|nr:DUF3244 domain-containing protein [Paludibacter sp.]